MEQDPRLIRRLLRAKDAIDAASDEAWPITRLAKVSGVSAAHFARSFKEAFGVPPHRYLLTRRIERAAALLRDTARPITDIAYETGWKSLGTFGRIFRDIIGASPGAIREREKAAPNPGALIPECFARAVQRPVLKTAVSEKRRAAAGGTKSSSKPRRSDEPGNRSRRSVRPRSG
jgi:AraC-like DNA-binding protein